jgi:hypothetical protein
MDSTCPICSGVTSEIDQHGERLVGCIKCNRWRPAGSRTERLFLQLPDEDLEALSNLSDRRHKAEDTPRDGMSALRLGWDVERAAATTAFRINLITILNLLSALIFRGRTGKECLNAPSHWIPVSPFYVRLCREHAYRLLYERHDRSRLARLHNSVARPKYLFLS